MEYINRLVDECLSEEGDSLELKSRFLGDEGMTLVYNDIFASGQIAATDARDYRPVLWIVGTFDDEERIPVAFVRGDEVVTRFVRVNSARTVSDDLRKATGFLDNERIPEVPPS